MSLLATGVVKGQLSKVRDPPTVSMRLSVAVLVMNGAFVQLTSVADESMNDLAVSVLNPPPESVRVPPFV